MSDLEDKSPGAAFEIFLKNESLMEKLKLLDFETQFVQKGLRKGLRRDAYVIWPRDPRTAAGPTSFGPWIAGNLYYSLLFWVN